MSQGLRHAIRSLRRTPAYGLWVVSIAAVGIGLNVAVFSLINGVLLRPLVYESPERLVVFWGGGADGSRPLISGPDFLDYKRLATTLEGMAATSGRRLSLSGVGMPVRVRAAATTHDLLSLLGVTPLIGRNFDPAEDVRGAPHVVLISEGLWERRFGRDPAVLGDRIVLDRQPHEIIGVLPSSFDLLAPSGTFLLKHPDAWVLRRGDLQEGLRATTTLYAIGRLAPGRTLADAQAEIDQLTERIQTTESDATAQIRLTMLEEEVTRVVRSKLWLLFGAVALVLLITTLNIANLSLVEALRRRRATAIRSALGAAKARLARETVLEHFILFLAAGAIGTWLAYAALGFLPKLVPFDIPRLQEVDIDLWVLTFALALTLLAAVVSGLMPSLVASRANPSLALRVSGGAGGTAAARHAQRLVVIGEISLSVLLLVATGLFLQSALALRSVGPGFEEKGSVTAGLSLPDARYPDDESRRAFVRRLEEAVGVLPGVQEAGVTLALPLADWHPSVPYRTEEEVAQGGGGTMADWRPVTPGYFAAMGIRLVSGRTFDSSDRASTRSVIVIDKSIAERVWGDQNPVGRALDVTLPSSWTPFEISERRVEVIGVVEHVRSHDLTREVQGQIYQPYEQVPSSFFSLAVRTSRNTEIVGELRRAVHALDPELPLAEAQGMGEYVRRAAAPTDFLMILLAVFGGTSLSVTALGLFAVIAYSISQRRGEIGVRLAIGATPRTIQRQVLLQGLRLTLGGVAIGVVASIAAAPVYEGLLFGVKPLDLWTLAAASFVLSLVALLACYAPSRRASRVDPAGVLRLE